jgi:excisionase family DNA binding protein
MSASTDKNVATNILGDALLDAIRQAVREEITALSGQAQAVELLTPEQLAARLHVPLSWVYEQSRQGKIPTHRLGRYIRFNADEVIASQKNKKTV